MDTFFDYEQIGAKNKGRQYIFCRFLNHFVYLSHNQTIH